MKEALKLAFEALEWCHGGEPCGTAEAITAIKAALAQPEQEQNNTYVYASNLAKTIWQKHYMKESPKFALLDTTEGVLTQIDNMTCGLVREKPAQQEPVAWWDEERDVLYRHCTHDTDDYHKFKRTVPLYTHPPQRTWVGLTDREKSNLWLESRAAIPRFNTYATLVEAKLKEKNNGLL